MTNWSVDAEPFTTACRAENSARESYASGLRRSLKRRRPAGAHLKVGWKGSMTRRFGNAGGESHRRHTSGHDDILLGEDHQCRRAIGIARGRLLPTPLTSDGEALEPGQSRSPLDPGAPSLLTCTSRGNAENRERVAIGKSFPGDFMKLPAQCDHYLARTSNYTVYSCNEP